ncbi:hypothetical protein [Streptomyces griseus]|uniref:hypothetical protein n=1 Tax=Streptomyces griseus TaxID=1911 RepID=UPI003676FC31
MPLGDADALFLDEPAIGQDAERRDDERELDRDLRDEAAMLLLATHDALLAGPRTWPTGSAGTTGHEAVGRQSALPFRPWWASKGHGSTARGGRGWYCGSDTIRAK